MLRGTAVFINFTRRYNPFPVLVETSSCSCYSIYVERQNLGQDMALARMMDKHRERSTDTPSTITVRRDESFHTSDNVVWNVNCVTLFGQVGSYGDSISTSYSPGLLWMMYKLGCAKADIH